MREFSQKEFDAMLEKVADEAGCGGALTIPGCYEIISEYFNNEVIEALEEEERTGQMYRSTRFTCDAETLAAWFADLQKRGN